MPADGRFTGTEIEMGTGHRVFFVRPDGSLRRVSLAAWERLYKGRETLIEFAGQRIRSLHVVLATRERKPTQIIDVFPNYLTFDSGGRVDRDALEDEMRLSVQVLAVLPPEDPGGVVHARHRFARREYAHRYRWEPSPALLRQVSALIPGTE